MFRTRFICLLTALVCIAGIPSGAAAAQVDSDSAYCFSVQDFSQKQEPLRGICVAALPSVGTVMLGTRLVQAGEILPADQLESLTYLPGPGEQDRQTQLCYLPIYDRRVEKCAAFPLSIRGKTDQAPVAEDSAVETYKNIPITGTLKVQDPEGHPLTYTLCRNSRRGTTQLQPDGTFTYTPKRNKVGIDSFTFTAADPAGKVSREATVTVQILKPTDSGLYSDTVNHPSRFYAEWMKNTGLFVGETVGGQSCFFPDKTLSRGQFLAMTVKLLDLEPAEVQALPENTPLWLRPYLSAALRAGLTDGLPQWEDTDAPITGGEAAVMLQNALELQVGDQVLETVRTQDALLPQWAAGSLLVLQEHGIRLSPEVPLTRGRAAQVLYTAGQLALTAPGTALFS